MPALGVVLILAGIILCFIPGPGLPLLIIGAALLAERSRVISRGLDWIEVKIRKVLRWGKWWWGHASGTTRFAAVLVAAVMVAGAGYAAYSVMFGQ